MSSEGENRAPEAFDLARIVSLTLRGGVVAAATFSLIGLVASFLRAPEALQDSASFPPRAALAALRRGDPAAIVLLGVAILIATPAVRVLEMLLSNIRRRDWIYAALSLAVLALMTAGIYGLSP